MLRTIVIKVLMLLLVIGGLNVIYTLTFYKKDLRERCTEVHDIRNTRKTTDVYYFGESSNVTFSPTDSIQSSISELTGSFFPSLRFTNINKYATHGGIYKHWIREFDLKHYKPKAVIITLNLRSFDAAWINSKLETQLQASVVLARPYPNIVNRFLLSLQAFDNKTEQQREQDMLDDWKNRKIEFPYAFKHRTVAEWDGAMANGSYLKPDGSWDMDKIVLACHYIKAYAFNLDETNPRIKDFDNIAAWCSEHKINLYLNLMAENIQYADSLVGKELVLLMKQNRDFLVSRYTKDNCKVVDNLELVAGKEFIDQKWTTEHYSYKGRMLIARNLAHALKEQFGNEFKAVY